jgi:uncharacterized membrane protein YtjA (UPF0391 family)
LDYTSFVHGPVIFLQWLAMKLKSMVFPKKTSADVENRVSLREMFPWLTFLLVFLSLTSLIGERVEVGGVAGAAQGVAVAVRVVALQRR